MMILRILLLPALLLLLATTTTTKASTDDDDDGTSDLLSSVQSSLAQHEKLAAIQVPELSFGRMDKIQETLVRIKELKSKRDALVNHHNTDQVKGLIAKLHLIAAAEQSRRELLQTQQGSDAVVVDVNETKAVSLDTLNKMFHVETVLAETEETMEVWIRNLIEIESATYSKDSSAKLSVSCLTANQAAQEVFAALKDFQRDGIGQDDIFQNGGASIVHELTSPTYKPPQTTTRPTLEHSWLRKFIPQDWEEWILPVGWKNWADPTAAVIPDHFYHTLGRSGPTTAPPEAILQSSTLPGSCWPVSMKSTSVAEVTIRLAQPAKIHSVTVDHASKLLVSGMEKNGQDAFWSAPRRIKVYGYDVDTTNALGFDVDSKALLSTINFDTEQTSNVQTFPVRDPNARGDEDLAATVAALTIEVVRNWGNPEYTCIYRVRAHGEILNTV